MKTLFLVTLSLFFMRKIYLYIKQKYFSTYEQIFDILTAEKLVVIKTPHSSENSDPFAEPVCYYLENSGVSVCYERSIKGKINREVINCQLKKKTKKWGVIDLRFNDGIILFRESRFVDTENELNVLNKHIRYQNDIISRKILEVVRKTIDKVNAGKEKQYTVTVV